VPLYIYNAERAPDPGLLRKHRFDLAGLDAVPT